MHSYTACIPSYIQFPSILNRLIDCFFEAGGKCKAREKRKEVKIQAPFKKILLLRIVVAFSFFYPHNLLNLNNDNFRRSLWYGTRKLISKQYLLKDILDLHYSMGRFRHSNSFRECLLDLIHDVHTNHIVSGF